METVDTLWYWQANLGRGVSEEVFRLNFDRVYRRGGAYSIFGLQEVDEADEANEADYIIDQTHRTHRAIGMKTGAPLLIPRGLDIVNYDTRLACKGLAKYTPNRYVTEAVVRLKHGTEVGVFNTHVPILRPATLTRRHDVRQALRDETRGHKNGLWLADTNTHRLWPRIVKGEKSAIDAGIDKSKVWAHGEGRVLVSQRATLNLTIDNHDAHGARLRYINAA